jgi:hypothetical protein
MNDVQNGAFMSSLKRANKQIKADRALTIVEDAELVFKREIEDMERDIKLWKRQLEGALDLSPDNSLSLVPAAKDFDPIAFKDEQVALTKKIRNKEIELMLATKRYNHLFGAELEMPKLEFAE